MKNEKYRIDLKGDDEDFKSLRTNNATYMEVNLETIFQGKIYSQLFKH